MYWKDTWRFPGSNEIEIKFAGNYGAKGERRSVKAKVTPEQIAKQNQRNKEKRMRRLIKANFIENDLWITLKYPQGTRKAADEVKRDLKNFMQRLRRAYAKRETDLKFIYRIEVGARGGIHIHMIANRVGPDSDVVVQKAWGKNGRVNFQSLYEEGGFEDLAAYIVKQPDEEQYEQLSLFAEEDIKDFIKFSCSRNLVRPEPERKYYHRRTVKAMLEEGVKPSAGYYIDKNSIVKGVNKYTGYSYLQYTEVLIKGKDKNAPPGKVKS